MAMVARADRTTRPAAIRSHRSGHPDLVCFPLTTLPPRSRFAACARLRRAFAAAILLATLPATLEAADLAGYPPPGDVNYVVSRNGDPIGTQEMDFVRDGDRFRVITRINIAVAFLGVTFYRFVTDSDELWIDGRFASFAAKTDDNGRLQNLTIRSAGATSQVVDNGSVSQVAGDLIPGTLWNPASLGATRLIDPVDGKLKSVRVVDRGPEPIMVRGALAAARHVSFTGEFAREVWYGADGRIVHIEYRGPDGSLVVTRLR